MVARFANLATRASQAASYIRPEILAIPKKTLDQYLNAKELQPYKLALERIIRFKPYTLPAREEEIIAMQGEMAGAAGKAFRQLLDADLKWGLVKNEKGEQVELSNATIAVRRPCEHPPEPRSEPVMYMLMLRHEKDIETHLVMSRWAD